MLQSAARLRRIYTQDFNFSLQTHGKHVGSPVFYGIVSPAVALLAGGVSRQFPGNQHLIIYETSGKLYNVAEVKYDRI